MPDFKKHLSLQELLVRKNQIEDIDYWRELCPNATISTLSIGKAKSLSTTETSALEEYQSLLREEAYFQTPQLLPKEMQAQMLECIENVKAAGYPPMFALVYDVFYEAFQYFDPILRHLLGEDYVLVPNFWVYYIDTTDESKGFEPHRDLEYLDTIDADGNPQVLTLWITVTDANPVNSCMYVVPANRDPEYKEAIHKLNVGGTKFKLEDIRAIPTEGGTLSAWNQYLFHWGSRGSRRAEAPRVSYALYCQRGDMPPVDDVTVDLSKGVDFKNRLAYVCRGMYRYSYVTSDPSQQTPELLAFLQDNMKAV